MSDRVWVKWLRAVDGHRVGDLSCFSAVEAQSLCRHGVACVAPADLRPRLRQTSVETTMATPVTEQAVTRSEGDG